MSKTLIQRQDLIANLFETDISLKKKDQMNTLSVTFQVTDACNLACSYCYQINKHKNQMKLETAQKFIDMLIADDEQMQYMYDTKKSKSVIIEFIGGEPFLEVDLMEDIYTYFVKQCIIHNHPWATSHMMSISSNGTLYFDPKVQAFIKRHMHELSQIGRAHV